MREAENESMAEFEGAGIIVSEQAEEEHRGATRASGAKEGLRRINIWMGCA